MSEVSLILLFCNMDLPLTSYLLSLRKGLKRGCLATPSLKLPSSNSWVLVDGEYTFPEKTKTLKQLYQLQGGIVEHRLDNFGLDFNQFVPENQPWKGIFFSKAIMIYILSYGYGYLSDITPF